MPNTPTDTTIADSTGTTEPVGDTLNPLLNRVFEAVLFDMDGTLVDSTSAVTRSWWQWAEEAGLGATFQGPRHGVPGRQAIAELLPADRVEDALVRVTELELSDTDGITILPGAAELLAGIPEQRRAIVTSCPRELCRKRMASAGLAAPTTVVTIEDTPRGKPFPEPFLEAAARLGADPARCLVIEDAPPGLEAARAAGCATIAVIGTHTASELDADLVVSGLDRLRVVVRADGVVLELLPA